VIRKKICMLGGFAVGKTSLVQQYVKGIFSEKYHATVGVKIDKKTVTVEDREVALIIWDIAGEKDFFKMRQSYLRGAAGYLVVVDGTRRDTLQVAFDAHSMANSQSGPGTPSVLLANKADLHAEWTITPQDISGLTDQRWTVFLTSAKTGENVELAFQTLAGIMLGG